MVGNILFYLLLAIFAFVIINIVIARKEGNIPNIGGYKFMNVLTGSMDPTIKEGSLIIVKEVNEQSIKVGDIITYNFDDSNNITTHRVVDVIQGEEGKEFVTRGDANNTNDPNSVKYNNVEGVVKTSIPKIGKAFQFMGENLIIVMISVIVVIILMIIGSNILKLNKKAINS